jgi:hypothetical protein
MMRPAQVRRRLKTIHKHQTKWDGAERELQAVCAHPNADKNYRGSTGNYDPSADSYWIEYRCPDCGKFWMTDQ